jgi:hypothetical protein
MTCCQPAFPFFHIYLWAKKADAIVGESSASATRPIPLIESHLASSPMDSPLLLVPREDFLWASFGRWSSNEEGGGNWPDGMDEGHSCFRP